MKIDKYALKAGTDLTVFEFISEGTKGAIRKIILFQPTNEPNLYNLAFGDKDPSRTRLYRIGITRFYEDMQRDFYLYGQVGDDFPEFELNQEYSGFLAKRKFV